MHQILFSTRKNEFGNYSDGAEGRWECVYEQNTKKKEWYNRFKGGRTSVDSDSPSGRP